MTISTWTGAAACRNVPHWVAAGNSRLVTKNMIRLIKSSGRSDSPRPCHGSATSPMTDTGMPSSTSTLKRLWARPAMRSSTRAAGPMARWRARVGGSFQAKMSKPERYSAFVTAWPGSGLPRTTRLRNAHGAKTTSGNDGDDADEPDPLARRPVDEEPGHRRPDEREPDRLVAGQRPQAEQHAQGDQARVGQRCAARVAHDAGHEQARAEHDHRERHRRVGQGRAEQQRQVDRRRQAGADPDPARPFEVEAAFLGDVERQPPGQDRHERPDDDARDLGRREGQAEDAPSGWRRGTSAAAARPRTPAAGTSSGGVW